MALEGFRLGRVLSEDMDLKRITVLGTCGSSALALTRPLTASLRVDVHRQCPDGNGASSRRIDGKEGEAIVTFQRRHFVRESLPHMLSSDTSTELHFSNDVYTKVGLVPPVWYKHPLVVHSSSRPAVSQTPGTAKP